MIKTESLKFSYDGKKYFDFPDINLDSGENLLIIGNLSLDQLIFQVQISQNFLILN